LTAVGTPPGPVALGGAADSFFLTFFFFFFELRLDSAAPPLCLCDRPDEPEPEP